MPQTITAKAVIFDRDGIIINTEGIVIDSVRKAFGKLGFTLQDDDISHMIGRSYDVYKNYFLEKWDFNFDEFRNLQKEIFNSNLHKAEYFKDTLDLIQSLHKQEIPIAVTTSAGRESTSLILSNANLSNIFNVIVTKEDCINLKPDPEPYITTAKKLNIDPNFCVVIEDTALGVEAAKKAGMSCIAIPNEFTKDQDFSMANLVLESAKEIEKVLDLVA